MNYSPEAFIIDAARFYVCGDVKESTKGLAREKGLEDDELLLKLDWVINLSLGFMRLWIFSFWCNYTIFIPNKKDDCVTTLFFGRSFLFTEGAWLQCWWFFYVTKFDAHDWYKELLSTISGHEKPFIGFLQLRWPLNTNEISKGISITKSNLPKRKTSHGKMNACLFLKTEQKTPKLKNIMSIIGSSASQRNCNKISITYHTINKPFHETLPENMVWK